MNWAVRKELVDLFPEETIDGHRYCGYTLEIRQFIRSKLPLHPTLNDFCTHSGLSLSAVRRRLSADGTSFGDIKRLVLLELGKKLLSESKLSVEEVAYELGFGCPGSFTRMFKRLTAVTPSRWRKSQRSQHY